MWKALRRGIRRTMKNWNIENRALKQLEKPTVPSPRYPTEERIISKLFREEAGIDKSTIIGLETQKDPKLDEWLKKVKVDSHETTATDMIMPPVEHDPRKKTSKRALPQRSSPVVYDEFGYIQTDKVTPGKIGMKGVLNLLSRLQEDPEGFNVPNMAKEFNLKEEDVVALAKHFSVYVLYTPKKGKEEAKLYRLSKVFGMSSDLTALEKSMKMPPGEFAAYGIGPATHQAYLARQAKFDKENEEVLTLTEEKTKPDNKNPPGTNDAKS